MGWGDSACGSCASSATSKGHVLFWEGGPSRPPWCASTSGLMAVWTLKRQPRSLVSRASAFGSCVSSVASRGHVSSWESGPSRLPWCASPPVRCHVVDREHTRLNLARSLPYQVSFIELSKGLAIDHCESQNRYVCQVRGYSADNLHGELSPVHASSSHTRSSETLHESSHSGSRRHRACCHETNL